MPGRRLITRLTIALGLPIALLGLLPPTPILAISGSISISSIDSTYCTPYINYIRTPTVNDGSSGFDYYRITLADNTGKVLSSGDHRASYTSGTIAFGPISNLLSQLPAANATSITAYMYDQTSSDANAGNGTLVAQSSAFGPLPAACGTSDGGGSGSSNGGSTATGADITYYPPDNRTLAYIRVNTPIYTLDNLNSQTVGTLYAGQTWFVISPDKSGQFWQVFLGGPNLGWVKASDITVSGQSSRSTTDNGSTNNATSGGSSNNNQPGIQTVPKGTVIGIVDTSRLHIHASGNILSPSIATASAGERYVLLGRLAGQTWVKVTGPAGTGWVNSFYMILSAPLSEVPVITG